MRLEIHFALLAEDVTSGHIHRKAVDRVEQCHIPALHREQNMGPAVRRDIIRATAAVSCLRDRHGHAFAWAPAPIPTIRAKCRGDGEIWMARPHRCLPDPGIRARLWPSNRHPDCGKIDCWTARGDRSAPLPAPTFITGLMFPFRRNNKPICSGGCSGHRTCCRGFIL